MPTYNLTARRKSAKYAVQLFRSFLFDPRICIPDSVCAGDKDVYAMYTGALVTDPTNYWIAWGGTFDNPVGDRFQMYFAQFLTQTETYAAMSAVLNTMYIDTATRMIYIHTPIPPWMYFLKLVKMYTDESSAFTTAPKDDRNLSDHKYGEALARPIMIVPSFSSDLSDAISGVTKYNNFNVSLRNNDGYFDTQDLEDFFNTPIRVLKTTDDAQTLPAFKKIRSGLVSDITVGYDSVSIQGSDELYQMKNNVCRVITTDEFVSADENINENMPIGWGTLNGAKLIKLWDATGTNYYLALDKNFITDVTACYDKDGVSQTFSFDTPTGVISSTSELVTADITGRADSSIGKIVTELLEEFENLPLVNGLWDVTETNAYIALSADIDLYINGGTTREAVESALKNDIAFLIQKNNGSLTIRQWGQTYDVFNIPSWATTGKPSKNFQDAYKYFCSSVKVGYNGGSVLDISNEDTLYEQFKKLFRATLTTVLHTSATATNLATRFMSRFGGYRETVNVALGVDTWQINLLDTVNYDPTINCREYSKYTSYIVKKTNPGQDTLELEGIS